MRAPFSIQTILAAFVLSLSCAPSPGEPVEELVAQGDALDAKFKAREALEYYLPAEKQQPKNVPLLLRIARQYRHMATDASSREDKLKLGNIALGYSQRAAALAPNDPEAQLSVAISYGKLLPILGKREQVDASHRIKAAADKTIQLDRRNDLAWHVLGRWNRVLADVSGVKRMAGALLYGELPTGTNEESVKCFEIAIKLNPSRLRHYIELGLTYAQMGRKAEARRYLEKGLSMPNVEKDDPEIKTRGREVLAKVK